MAFVVQEAAEKMSISSDCIRFGLHHEQYLVRLYPERSIILYVLLKLMSTQTSFSRKSTCIIDNQGVVNSI
jgi:hypothetical protein